MDECHFDRNGIYKPCSNVTEWGVRCFSLNKVDFIVHSEGRYRQEYSVPYDCPWCGAPINNPNRPEVITISDRNDSGWETFSDEFNNGIKLENSWRDLKDACNVKLKIGNNGNYMISPDSDILKSGKYSGVRLVVNEKNQTIKVQVLDKNISNFKIDITGSDKNKIYFTISNIIQKNSDQINLNFNSVNITPEKLMEAFAMSGVNKISEAEYCVVIYSENDKGNKCT